MSLIHVSVILIVQTFSLISRIEIKTINEQQHQILKSNLHKLCFKFPKTLEQSLIVRQMSTRQEKIQLTIRCALQTLGDYNVECSSDWTIGELKRHLTQICDFKPDFERQRLIYAGRCLDNGQKIEEVLKLNRDGIQRPEEQQLEKQVIHMVYIGKEEPVQSGEGARQRTNVASVARSPPTRVDSSSNTHPIMQNPVAVHQSHEAWLAAYQAYYAQMAHFYQHGGVPYPVQYGLWNSNGNYHQIDLTRQQTITNQPQFVGVPLGQPNQQMAVQPLLPPNPQQQVPLANAPDMLDLIYKSIRFALLAMVLYLYSSLERFFFVLSILALFWFVRTRRGQQQQPNGDGRAEERREEEVQPGAPNQQNALVNQPAHIGNEDVPQAAPNQNPARQPSAPVANGAWNIFFQTVQSFFASLIPENQAPLELN